MILIDFFKGVNGSATIKNTLFIFILALVVRVTYVWFFVDISDQLIEDQQGYKLLGENMAQTSNFFQLTDGRHTSRTPGYPIFLAVVYTLFGESNLTLILVQIIINSLTCVVIGLIAGFIVPRGFLVAGLISSLNLGMVIYSGMILTDILFLFFFSLFILFAFHYLKSPKKIQLFLTISLLSIATFVRPVTYFFIMLLPVLLIVWFVWRRMQPKQILYSLFVYFIPVVIAFSAIHYRNYTEYNSVSLTNQGGGHALYWVVPATYQYSGQGSYQEGKDFSLKYLDTSIKKDLNNNHFKRDDYYMQVAKEALLELGLLNILHAWSAGAIINLLSPSAAVAPLVRNMEHPSFYETPGNGSVDKLFNYITNTSSLLYLSIVIIGTIVSAVFLIISIFGLYRMIKFEWVTGQNREMVLFSLFIIIYFMAITGPIIGVKYRLPIEPIMTMFFSYALVKFRNNHTNNK
jgi:4-amino-4-deoxy-L-arabinose transferase-like glycosyltransferase